MQLPQCTLIITTYNWPEALEKVLQTVMWQSVLPDEVLIADDGSKDETKQMLAQYQRKFPIPLRHFWQEDIKKRKTRINNIAIANARYPYLIFIDHDVLLHPHFIKDHLTLAECGYFINGSRYLLTRASTQRLIVKQTLAIKDLKNLEGKNRLNTLRNTFLMHLLAHKYQTKDKDTTKVRGCNMSFWLKDLMVVNGYDEHYQGWGREDSDIAIRLYHSGIRKKSLKFGGIEYHLHHNQGNKTDDELYRKRLQAAREMKTIKAPAGLDQHIKTDTFS